VYSEYWYIQYDDGDLLEQTGRIAMVRHIALLIVLAVVPSFAKADSFVSVQIEPTRFEGSQLETVTGSFFWDTTTQVLSNITITESGGYGNGSVTEPDVALGQDFIGRLSFPNSLPSGDVVAFDSSDHGSPLFSTPGTQPADLVFVPCCIFDGTFDLVALGKAVVTPIPAPEPSSMNLLLIGLALTTATVLSRK
jgi:hypothetical protein